MRIESKLWPLERWEDIRPTFVPSLVTIGSQLRPLECFLALPLEESPTTSIGTTYSIFDNFTFTRSTCVYMYLRILNEITISSSHIHPDKTHQDVEINVYYDSHTWEMLSSKSRF